MLVWSLSQEDPPKEGLATHSSILAWSIPWTEEPGRLPSKGSQSRTRLQQLSTHAREALSPPLVRAQLLSRVWLFASLWTVARQAPLFMEFSRQEYWSGLPFLSPRWSALFCIQWIPQSLLLKPGSVYLYYFFLKTLWWTEPSDNTHKKHTHKFSG